MKMKVMINISVVILWLYMILLSLYVNDQLKRSAKLHLQAAYCILTLQEYVANQEGIDISDVNGVDVDRKGIKFIGLEAIEANLRMLI